MNHVPMRLKAREVTNVDFIEEMLGLFDTCHVGMFDDDGYPYVVPMNFGYERTDTSFIFYFHFAKQGHKVDLFKANPKVCLNMSAFQDFPEDRLNGHKHDYRSVIAKGEMRLIEQDEEELYLHAHEVLMVTNGRPFDKEARRGKMPPLYIGIVECPFENVRAKSEFPIETIEDVHFKKLGRMKNL